MNPATAKGNLKATAAGAGAKGELPGGTNAGLGFSVGNVEMQDGKMNADIFSGGSFFKPSATLNRKVSDGNTSSKLLVDAASGEMSLGAQLGVVGFLIKFNVVNAFNAMADGIKLVSEIAVDKVKDNLPSELGGNNRR